MLVQLTYEKIFAIDIHWRNWRKFSLGEIFVVYGSNIRGHSIIYLQIGSVIGWFAGYRAAVVRTQLGTNVVMNCQKLLLNRFQTVR